MIRQAVENRLPFDIKLDCRLPDIVFPETVCAAGQATSAAIVYRMGHVRAFSTIQPPPGAPVAPVAPPAAPSPAKEGKEGLAARLAAFYKKYNPEKVASAEAVAGVFFGKESELNAKLRETYNADLSSLPANKVGAAGGGGGGAGGGYDRCEATWSGWKILVCGATQTWETLGPVSPECALAVGDVTWQFDVSVARNDMGYTQLLVRLNLPSIDVRCSRRTLERVTAVSLAVYGDVNRPLFSNVFYTVTFKCKYTRALTFENLFAAYGDVNSRPAVELDNTEVSTMVSLASGGVGMLESGWYTLRRREMGMRKGRVSEYV
jgi:hypothetical protein